MDQKDIKINNLKSLLAEAQANENLSKLSEETSVDEPNGITLPKGVDDKDPAESNPTVTTDDALNTLDTAEDVEGLENDELTEEVSVDVRLITATNRDLAELVREGKFREDLYHRLCVVQIHAPSLREHKEDIEQIANGRWLKEHHRRLEPEQIEVLKTYDYPGNVRELINILDRASVLDESDFAKLLKEHKEMTAGLRPETEKNEEIPDELEAAVRIHVKRIYEKYDRNLTKTAEALKAARNTVKKYLED